MIVKSSRNFRQPSFEALVVAVAVAGARARVATGLKKKSE